jgi:Flp pilus assembly protein TadG
MAKSTRPVCVRRWMLQHSSSEAGAVALEFAMVVPLFLVLIFATMVFALYFATFVAVIHGANEGARASVAGMSDGERGTLALARVTSVFVGYSPLLNPAHVAVQGTAPVAGMFQVTVSYPLSDFDFGAFYALFATAAPNGAAIAKPAKVTYSVTIADGGY